MYQDKLASLKEQLRQLENGTHPDYINGLKKLEDEYNRRMLLNEAYLQFEVRRSVVLLLVFSCILTLQTERAEKEYIREKKAAVMEFDEKKIELMGSLIADLEEKKRMAEAERHCFELNSDSVEPRPTITRKLRRRQNDPIPAPEKRKRGAPGSINCLLDEREVLDDVQALNRSINKKS